MNGNDVRTFDLFLSHETRYLACLAYRTFLYF